MVDRIIYESSVGKMIQTTWEAYRGTVAVNPSSLAAGLVGNDEVDVRAIHAAMTGTQSPPAQATQDRMDRGTVIHYSLLQPHKLADVAVWDGKRRSGAEWDAFEHENAGKLIMRRQDWEHCCMVAGVLKNHPMCGGKLVGCESEVAMFLNDGGIPCRGQVDAIDLQRKRIIDVKTTDGGISKDACERTIRSLRYREKMAMYRRWAAMITQTNPMEWRCWNMFLSMDIDCPSIRYVWISDDALEWGEVAMVRALRKYQEALQYNHFPVHAVEDFVDVKPWEVTEQEGGDDVEYD